MINHILESRSYLESSAAAESQTPVSVVASMYRTFVENVEARWREYSDEDAEELTPAEIRRHFFGKR